MELQDVWAETVSQEGKLELCWMYHIYMPNSNFQRDFSSEPPYIIMIYNTFFFFRYIYTR